jgi:hypothetical protein
VTILIRVAALLAISAVMVFAQRTELGGMAGGGAFAVASGVASGSGQVGVEACLFCPGRLALFGEYSHWVSAEGGAGSDRVKSADLAGAGLRIQWLDRTRPFFDVGIVAGSDRHRYAGQGGFIGGAVVAAGIRIPLGEHWYIRPQVRSYVLSPHSIEGLSLHWAVSAGVGVGYLFRAV